MVLDNMRGGYGRCPPFLAGGLLVMCIILVFNWWSLSTQNYGLIKRLQEMSEQLRISAEEQDVCVQQKLTVETRNKATEDELAKLRVRVEQTRTESDDLKKTIETKEEELKSSLKNKEEAQGNADRCNTELDSLKKLDQSKDDTMISLRLENDRVSTELKQFKQTVQQLQADLLKAKGDLSSVKSGKQSKTPLVKTAVRLHAGDLLPVAVPSALEVHYTALKGMIFHRGELILPQDPPNTYRQPPRFSVTQLKMRKDQAVTLPANNIAVGGDHELDKQMEAEENNNAKEERDDADVPADADADVNQMGEPDPRMEVAEEDTAHA